MEGAETIVLPNAYLQEVKKGSLARKHHLCIRKARIGRNVAAEIPVNSSNVSRNHALLEFNDDLGWCITDNNSINGVYLDKKNIPKDTLTPLQHGQLIHLGPPELASDIYFEFCMPLPSETENKPGTSAYLASPGCNHEPRSKESRCLKKRSSMHCSTLSSSSKKKQKTDVTDKIDTSSLRGRLAAVDSLLKRNESIDERVMRILNQTADDKFSENTDYLSKFSSSILTPKTHDSDPAWSEWMADEASSTMANQFSIDPMIFSPPKTLDDVDNMFDGATQKNCSDKEMLELKEKVAKLEKELEEREKAKTRLQEELKEKESRLKEEKEQNEALVKHEEKRAEESLNQAKAVQQQVSSEVATHFGEILESELTCSICTELFVKATTLTCSHTFCHDCLEKWNKTKKECPICRHKIDGMTHSIVIDGFIEKLVEKLSAEEQEKRKQVLFDRNKPKQPPAPRPKKKRKTRATRFSGAQTYFIETPQVSLLGNLRDNIINLTQMMSFHATSEEQQPNLDGFNNMYGGYGRCYNCGGLGHWARGCPELV